MLKEYFVQDLIGQLNNCMYCIGIIMVLMMMMMIKATVDDGRDGKRGVVV